MRDFQVKSFDDFYALLEKGWNCAEAFTPEYEAEHEAVHISMKAELHRLLGGESFGPMSFDAFGAFEDCWTVSRVVGAYLNSNSFLRPDFVSQLEHIVDGFADDYLLHIVAQDFEPGIGDFELAISKSFTWALLYDNPSDITKIYATPTDPENKANQTRLDNRH